MYKDNEFQRISLIDVFIFAEEVRLSPMKDMALDGAASLRLAVSAFPSGHPPLFTVREDIQSALVRPNPLFTVREQFCVRLGDAKPQ